MILRFFKFLLTRYRYVKNTTKHFILPDCSFKVSEKPLKFTVDVGTVTAGIVSA